MQTARYFPLLPDGGALRMESTDPQNSIIPANIQRHLDSICTMLQAGNLNVPLFTQTATPAEMRSLQRVKADI
ncbi:MAG TPA: hypothetical protein VKT32_05020 [Chthonomonadaceae bacterium]|nr:hypothetical protein [Chthonomonadaceae bacterium]